MPTIAHAPAATPDAGLPPAGTLLGWAPLGQDTLTGYVVLKRGLTAGATGPAGYWSGPDDPDRYCDCLAVLNMRTRGRLDYAPVATFPGPGIAWSTWNRWHGRNLGHGWTLEIHHLTDIRDWTRIPAVGPRGRRSGTADRGRR